jgi:hypothetical protein
MLEEFVCSLPHGEGSVLIQDDTIQPSALNSALRTTLSSATLIHGGNHVNSGTVGVYCGGTMAVTTVSESKQVLYCHRCGLRIAVPYRAICVDDLRTMQWP